MQTWSQPPIYWNQFLKFEMILMLCQKFQKWPHFYIIFKFGSTNSVLIACSKRQECMFIMILTIHYLINLSILALFGYYVPSNFPPIISCRAVDNQVLTTIPITSSFAFMYQLIHLRLYSHVCVHVCGSKATSWTTVS